MGSVFEWGRVVAENPGIVPFVTSPLRVVSAYFHSSFSKTTWPTGSTFSGRIIADP